MFNNLERAKSSRIHQELGIDPGNYGVLTRHRPSNVEDAAGFTRIIEALELIGKELPLVFPMHPRTQSKIKDIKIQRFQKYKEDRKCFGH